MEGPSLFDLENIERALSLSQYLGTIVCSKTYTFAVHGTNICTLLPQYVVLSNILALIQRKISGAYL